jgi:hypothetical protein
VVAEPRVSPAGNSSDEAVRIAAWAEAAVEHADLADIDDPAGVVATVDGLDGVWAHGVHAQAAKRELFEVLIDWASLKMQHGDDDIPSIDGVSLYAIQ